MLGVAVAHVAQSAVEQAELLLPQWVRWLPLVWIPFAFGVSAGVTWLAVRSVIPREELQQDEHWTVRARLWFSARLAVLVAAFGGITVATMMTQVGELSAIPAGPLYILVFIVSLGGAYFGGYRRAQRKYARRKSGVTAFKDAVVVGLLFFPGYLTALLFIPVAGWLAVVIGIPLTVALCWRGAFQLLVLAGLARPAEPGVQQRIDRLCEQAGQEPVPVWVLDWSMANACALIHERKLAFSRRCLEVLDPSEADAVAAHELGHLTEGIWVQVARLAAAPAPLCLLLVAEISAWSFVGFSGWFAVGHWLSARMERRADREAVRLSDQQCYARALLRIHEDALLPAVIGAGGGPHGSLYDRMLSVGVQPDFPRPDKPRFGRACAWAAAAMVVGLALAILTRGVYRPDSIRSLEIVAALDDLDVPRLARAEAFEGSLDRARVFAEAGVALRPQRPDALYSLIVVELLAGDCDRVYSLEARLAALPNAQRHLARLSRRSEYGVCVAHR